LQDGFDQITLPGERSARIDAVRGWSGVPT
jgi:hypothetical protein